MHLDSFRVSNYRSINNSGDIDVARITALLGRNETGKSNLLKSLASLNPSDGIRALNATKDFPRDRRLSECTEETPVLDTRWALDDNDRAELQDIYPRAANATHADVTRRYGKKQYV